MDHLYGRERRFLTMLVSTLSLSDSWNEILQHVVEDVKSLKNVIDVDEELFTQLMYELVGKQCRHLWGVNSSYKGENLREPYIRQYHKKEHIQRLTQQLSVKIAKTTLLHKKSQSASIYRPLRQTLRNLLAHYICALATERYELLGAAMVATFNRHSPIFNIITTPLHVAKSCVLTSTTAVTSSVTSVPSRPVLPYMDATTHTHSWNSNMTDHFCSKFQGHLLPDTLRQPLWLARLNKRHWDDLPTPTLTEELTRLSMEKNMPSAPYIVPPSLSDLVERTVDYLLQLALPHAATANAIKVNRGEGVELRRLHHKMSLSKVLLAKQAKQKLTNLPSPPHKSPQSIAPPKARPFSSSKINSLKKRIQLLTSAIYVLTGTISERTASIALLIMTIYPDESPVAESMLSLHVNIINKYLPSEQLHRTYSIASTALTAWNLISKQDSTLVRHIEKLMQLGETSEKDKHPVYYALLYPWINSGFVGYVPSHTLGFIWDQLVMWGTRPEDFATMIPRICCVILQVVRDDVKIASSKNQLLETMQQAPLNMRSKDFFEAFRHQLPQMRRRVDMMNAYLPFRNTCAIAIQRMTRGLLARKFVAKLRRKLARATSADYSDTNSWLASSEAEAIENERKRRIQQELAAHRGQEYMRSITATYSAWRAHVCSMQTVEKRVVQERKMKITRTALREWKLHVQHTKLLHQLLVDYLAHKEKLRAPTVFKKWKSFITTAIVTKTIHRMVESIETNSTYESISDVDSASSVSSHHEIDSDEEEANAYLDIKSPAKYGSFESPSPRLNEEEELSLLVDVMDVIDSMVDALCFEEERSSEDSAIITPDLMPPTSVTVDVQVEAVVVSLVDAVVADEIARSEITSTLNALIQTIETQPSQPLQNVASTSSLQSGTTESTEDAFDSTHIPELRKIMHAEMLKPLAVVAKGMAGPKRTLGSVRHMLKRASVLGQTASTFVNTIPLSDESDDKFFSISDTYRRNIRSVEIDALQGFFLAEREVIGDLVEEKRIVKHSIQQWKEHFVKKNKGKEPSAAHKKEISDSYKKYHELTQELKIKIQELRIAEDELLLSWNKK